MLQMFLNPSISIPQKKHRSTLRVWNRVRWPRMRTGRWECVISAISCVPSTAHLEASVKTGSFRCSCVSEPGWSWFTSNCWLFDLSFCGMGTSRQLATWFWLCLCQNMIVSSAQLRRTYMEKTNLRTDSEFFLITEKRITMHWRIDFFVLFCHIYQSHILRPVLSFCLQRSPAAPLDCASCRVSNHSTDVRRHGAL